MLQAQQPKITLKSIGINKEKNNILNTFYIEHFLFFTITFKLILLINVINLLVFLIHDVSLSYPSKKK
jgi:hypothetical protein